MEDNTNVGQEEIRVLLVDDDSTFRWVLARRLKRMGVDFVEAEDGEQAIKALEEGEFTLLITDIYMPGKDGFEVIQVARSLYKDIQVILMTASSTLENAIKALRNRVFDYLTKPMETLAIFDLTVNRALRHRMLEKANEELFEKVKLLSITDPLTDLYNRRKLEEVIESEAIRASEFNRDLSLVMIDVDNLKTVNDTFGHNIGDWVLIQVAETIKNVFRKSDIASRYGGDEFMVLLPETKALEAISLSKKILESLPNSTDEKPEIEVCIGIAEWTSTFKGYSDLIEAVDKALYKAKNTKGRRISIDDTKPLDPKVVE
jgi:diguanylate cyclase (GGDEF)-like protein